MIMLSEEEIDVLLQIYRFQRPRGFRFGLNKKYIRGVADVDNVIERLREKGLVFTITPYRDKERYVYVLLTKKGREIVENLLLGRNTYSVRHHNTT